MHKPKISKKQSFYLSQKLVKRLSYKQLILLLPTIVDKLISENQLQINDDKSEEADSLSVAGEDINKSNQELSEKDDVSKDSITCKDVTNYVKDDAFPDKLQVQSKFTKSGESLPSAKMSDEIVKKFKSYADKLTKKYSKIFSQINYNLMTVSDFTNNMDANKEALEKSHGDILDVVSQKKKGSNLLEEMESNSVDLKHNFILETMQIDFLQDNYLAEEDQENYTFVETSIIKSRRKHYSTVMNEVAIYRGYKLKWSEGKYCSNKLICGQNLYKTGPYFCLSNNEHITEVQIDTGEESRRSQTSKAADCKIRKTKYPSPIAKRIHYRNKTSNAKFPLNNPFDINQKGDTVGAEAIQVAHFLHQQQPMKHLFINSESLESILTTSVSEKCGLLFSTTIIDDSEDHNFSKQCTTLSQKCHRQRCNNTKRYKHKTTDPISSKIKDYKSKLRSKNKSETRRMENKRSTSKEWNVGLSTSRIINGRFRHGWQCSYKECLTFNPGGRPTCCNCFNSRWCWPYLSKRDTICPDCGYVNYKSRLYCKKCKFMFFQFRNNIKMWT